MACQITKTKIKTTTEATTTTATVATETLKIFKGEIGNWVETSNGDVYIISL